MFLHNPINYWALILIILKSTLSVCVCLSVRGLLINLRVHHDMLINNLAYMKQTRTASLSKCFAVFFSSVQQLVVLQLNVQTMGSWIVYFRSIFLSFNLPVSLFFPFSSSNFWLVQATEISECRKQSSMCFLRLWMVPCQLYLVSLCLRGQTSILSSGTVIRERNRGKLTP